LHAQLKSQVGLRHTTSRKLSSSNAAAGNANDSVTNSRKAHNFTIRDCRFRWVLALVILNLGLYDLAYAERFEDLQTCRQWLDRVAESPYHGPTKEEPLERLSPEQIEEQLEAIASAFSDPDPWRVARLTETEKLNAIQCLLEAQNDLRPASFGGVTRLDVSQIFAPVRANLAALFAISYIYNGRYDHADAVALQGDNASYSDSDGFYATKSSAVHKAYQAHRAWFAKVRQIGLARAKQAGLQPLDDTDLDWYGRRRLVRGPLR
jgi:hypothetical protein